MDIGEISIVVITIAGTFIIGSVPSSVIFAKMFGLADPRTFGSGNPGATNIARTGNKTAAILTLLADAGKGAVPVWLLGTSELAGINNISNAGLAAVAGVMLVTGHVFSVFLRFRGGKGVATALGVFLAWDVQSGTAALAVWLVVFLLFRISSAASIAAMLTAALVLAIFEPQLAGAGACVTALVVWRHRRNIADMLHRKESGFGRK